MSSKVVKVHVAHIISLRFAYISHMCILTVYFTSVMHSSELNCSWYLQICYTLNTSPTPNQAMLKMSQQTTIRPIFTSFTAQTAFTTTNLTRLKIFHQKAYQWICLPITQQFIGHTKAVVWYDNADIFTPCRTTRWQSNKSALQIRQLWGHFWLLLLISHVTCVINILVTCCNNFTFRIFVVLATADVLTRSGFCRKSSGGYTSYEWQQSNQKHFLQHYTFSSETVLQKKRE